MTDSELLAMAAELVREARTLTGYAEEAAKYVEDGNLQAAKEVVGVSSYTIKHVMDVQEAIFKHLARK